MEDTIEGIKSRMKRQFLYSLAAKSLCAFAVSLFFVRSEMGWFIVALVILFLAVSEASVYLMKTFKSLDQNFSSFGQRFLDDSHQLLADFGDFKVYHQLMLTTYRDGRFEN